uniref:Uncharacterized protein n=1 Tax=Physcomitrium patens TaxID=3218 RepID=A0A2K1JY76_PHYPA|nr:hypothetical protein PHYPA_013600 [Physcomitrium patens]
MKVEEMVGCRPRFLGLRDADEMSVEDSVRSYIASLIPSARARASASVEDATTVDCLFDAQETGLPADSKTYPVMDFRSTWQLPSPSVYIPKW